jgi:coenzyme F420 biosynthesis associated uncharacterized protein
MMGSDAIDWGAAQRIGELIAGAGGQDRYGGVSAGAIEPRAHDFAARVSAYTGLELAPAQLPPLEVVDRRAWIAANLRTMKPLLDPLTARIGGGDDSGGGLAGIVSGPLRAASGLLFGAQVGALTGVLSQRVLGQYDLALLDDEVQPRLLLLAPNLAQAARNLGVDRDELVLWVTIHEITHAVQFGGAPWLREHLGGMLLELIDGLQVKLHPRSRRDDLPAEQDKDKGTGGGAGGWFPKLDGLGINPGQLRELLERARRGELLRLTLGDERWHLVERMQATMSLIEGHAEHTMDAVGAEVLPSLPRLRAALNRRRETRGLPWRVLERLLGLELKLKQYEVGKRFCDAVVQAEGPQALARVWEGPELLPSTAELETPRLWLVRTHVPPVTSSAT